MVFRIRSFMLVAALATTVGVALARPDLNAFLNHRATTTAQLVRQSETDSVVMDRYMRHFGMTRDEVISYLQSLHPGILESDMVLKIYSVPEGGYVKTHVGRIKKGTPMFFSANGDPALIALCGNPVTEGKTPTLVTITPPAPVGVGDTHAPTLLPPTTEQTLAMAQPMDVELPTLPPEEHGRDNLGVAPGINASPLLGLLGLGAFGLVSTGGHHGSPPPVPEPATIAALAMGAALVVKRRKKS